MGDKDYPFSKCKASNGKTFQFCFNCAKEFKLENYCPFCCQLSVVEDGLEWIQCEAKDCERWVHIECEIFDGFADLKAKIEIEGDAFIYYCKKCRAKPSNKANLKSKKA